MSGLVALPAQPAGVPWPTEEWPEGTLPVAVDLEPLLDQVFDDEGPLATTFAVLVVAGGRVVAERYHGALEHFDRPPTPVTRDTPLLSWSMAKSVLHAVVGLLVGDGRLDLDAPAAVPEWAGAGDRRGAITLRQLLAMRDGLDWVEDYVDDRVSDVINMLFGDGQSDMAHFAADRAPGRRAGHSLQLLVGHVQHRLGYRGPHRRAGRALRPLPARTALRPARHARAPIPSSTRPAPGSRRPTCAPRRATGPASGCSTYATACGTAPVSCPRAGWTTGAPWCRSTTRTDPSPFGAHWWGMRGDTLESLDPLGTFRASGYEGQSITICPPLDLVVVRLGKTPYEREDNLVPWRAAMVRAFADAR